MSMSPEDLLKCRTHFPMRKFPPGYFRRSNALRRGRKTDPNSRKIRIEKLRKRLSKLHLPKAWAKPIEAQGLPPPQLKELLAQAASLKNRLDDLRLDLRRLIHGEDNPNGVSLLLNGNGSNGLHRSDLHPRDESLCGPVEEDDL